MKKILFLTSLVIMSLVFVAGASSPPDLKPIGIEQCGYDVPEGSSVLIGPKPQVDAAYFFAELPFIVVTVEPGAMENPLGMQSADYTLLTNDATSNLAKSNQRYSRYTNYWRTQLFNRILSYPLKTSRQLCTLPVPLTTLIT